MAAVQTSSIEIACSFNGNTKNITFDPSVWTSQDKGSKVLLEILQTIIDPTLPSSTESQFVVLGLGLYDKWNDAIDIVDNLNYSAVYAKKKTGGRPKTLMQKDKNIVRRPGSLLDASLILPDPVECDAVS